MSDVMGVNKTRSALASALLGASIAFGVSSCSLATPDPSVVPVTGLSPAPTVAAPVVAPIPAPAAVAPTTKHRAAKSQKTAEKSATRAATEKTATRKTASSEKKAASTKKKGKSAADCERIGNESSMPNSDLYPYLRSIGCGRWLDSAIDDAAAENGGRGAH